MDHKINSADLTELIDAIVAGLPRHSRIAAEVERTSTQWLSLLLQAIAQVTNPEELPLADLVHFQEEIRAWLQQPPLSSPFASAPSSALVASAVQPPPSTPSSWPSQLGQPASPLADQERLWALAIAQDRESVLRQSRELAKTPPYDAPRVGDIVFYGTRYKSNDLPPQWVGAAAEFPLFASSFPNFAEDTQLWLSFGVDDGQGGEPPPPWVTNDPNRWLLWRRWHDLRCWAILAPKAVVFVNEKREELSADEAREAICKTLLAIHRNFEHALRHPEQNLIGVNLHKVYAAFYQFLLPEDLDANQVEAQGVFATLRREIRRTLDAWLGPLQIEQEYAAGPPRTKEYLANVRKAAPRNIRLTRQDRLLEKMMTPARENQVVYWLKPKWRQIQAASMELPGSVLYVFD